MIQVLLRFSLMLCLAWSSHAQQRVAPGTIIKDCADCPELLVIPAGSFTMGSSAAEQVLAVQSGLTETLTRRESPQYQVSIRSFAAGRYAISKGEFAAFVRAKGYQTEAERGNGCAVWNGKGYNRDAAYNWRNVGFAQADNHPAVCVSWNDAQAYIGWLNQSSGQTYRLLSEAEREYAARGGSQSAFWSGDSISTAQANYGGTGPSYNGSPKGEWRQATVAVNSFSPNPFGLYNVHGNVWEWVEDCWHDNYTGAPTDGSAWTTGCSGNSQVARGGSWESYPVETRSAHRGLLGSGNRRNNIGLRLARTLHAQSLTSNAISSIAGPPLEIAFAYVGPIGDGGWTYAHELGRKAIEKEFGDKVKISFTENVPESADAERVFRDMASQGNKLIFGTTFGYMEPMLKIALDFKDVKFEHATGFKQADNMRTYDSRTYEGAYMAGVIAGKMTKTNTFGVVASIPIPEVIRNINSFTLGAQSSNPKVKTKVVWVNGWFDPPKETQAATSLINGGADVLLQNTDSPAVLKTAEAKGKRAFGLDSDMSAYAPKAHLGSAVTLWGPYYIEATRQALNGSWKGDTGVWWGVKEGAIDLVSIAKDVPADTKTRIAEIKKGLSDGSFVIWKGPITDNTGKVQIAKDAVADDNFLNGMNFYVKGVEGNIPGKQEEEKQRIEKQRIEKQEEEKQRIEKQRIEKQRIEKQRIEKQQEEKQRIEYAEEFPFYAVITCGKHFPVHACFSGRVNTELELLNGNEYKMYTLIDIMQIPQDQGGISFNLRNKFEIKMQNSDDSLVLNLKIYNRANQQIVFEKSATRFGVIRISN